MTPRRPVLVLSCEHASAALPAAYGSLLAGRARLLRSHRGWDPGALSVARALSRALSAPLVAGRVTRLLVDLNRSPHNPAVIGALARRAGPETRRELLARHHFPHWTQVRALVEGAVSSGTAVLHVAVHSFAPVLGGVPRAFDLGLLYDPGRSGERRLAGTWKAMLEGPPGALRVRRNAPYRGRNDGLTTALRKEWGPRRYLGFELELSQALLSHPGARRRTVDALVASLGALAGPGSG